MSHIGTIFCDVGGVCLTNGWDTGMRRSAASHFSLDFEEMEERHQALEDAFERGERSLDTYLDTSSFIGVEHFRATPSSSAWARDRSPTRPRLHSD